MSDIGDRAYLAICERAKQNGRKKTAEAMKAGVSPTSLFGWEKRNTNPSALALQQMALAGYDVIWILTGEVTK